MPVLKDWIWWTKKIVDENPKVWLVIARLLVGCLENSWSMRSWMTWALYILIIAVFQRSLWKSSTGQVVAFRFFFQMNLLLATMSSFVFQIPMKMWDASQETSSPQCRYPNCREHGAPESFGGSVRTVTLESLLQSWYDHEMLGHFILQFSNLFSGEDPVLCSCYVSCSRPRTGERTPPEKSSGKMAWGDDSGFCFRVGDIVFCLILFLGFHIPHREFWQEGFAASDFAKEDHLLT